MESGTNTPGGRAGRLPRIKERVRSLPLIGEPLARVLRRIRGAPEFASSSYWEARYAEGGTSGAGSYGRLAEFKARVINAVVAEYEVCSIVEWGCGDGNQLGLIECESYLGLDTSASALDLCRQRFGGDRSRRFELVSDYQGETADLALSLDVIYHLVEDAVFEEYMRALFASARRLVVIYSTDFEGRTEGPAIHVRHRRFTDWVAARAPEFRLRRTIENEFPADADDPTTSACDFFVFERER